MSKQPIENFPGQNRLYGKQLTILVYDAMLSLSKEGLLITNKSIREKIIQSKFNGTIPREEELALKERILSCTNSIVSAGMATFKEFKNEFKVTYKVFYL